MKTWLKVAFVLTALSGCAGQRVQTQISRVHTLPPDLTAKTFAVLPMKEQQGNPEFDLYANEVAARLQAKGMLLSREPHAADYILMLSYGIGDGKSVTSAVPIFGQTGGGTAYQQGTVQSYGSSGANTATYSGTTTVAPTFGVVGTMPVTNTMYTRALEIDLVDVKRTPNPAESVTYSFKGRAVSTGASATFMAVSNCLIGAIMDGFPGVSGSTNSIETPSEKCVR